MNRDFKLKFDELSENKTDMGDASSTYPGPGHVRNICFVQTNGNKLFLNYAFIVACEYLVEENKIALTFSSHTITLAGINMSILYQEFMQQLPKVVVCSDARFNAIGETEKYLVNEIAISSISK